MFLNFILVKIDSNYCDYLRKFDSRVSYNKNQKELRPFVGVLFKIENFEYFAPLTSPKKKHLSLKNTIDFIKLDGGKLGAINFNNMLPVRENNYTLLDLDKKPTNKKDILYYNLLKNQLLWLNNHKIKIRKTAENLYKLYLQDRLFSNIKNRCCDFKLLEQKCLEYNQVAV